MTDTDPRVKVAQNLTAIQHLSEHLLTQAVHSANDRELPGGDAMVALGPVADPSAYAENVDAAEWRHSSDPARFPAPDLSHEDDDLAPVLQTLWYWSDEWRTTRGYPLEGRRATVSSEAGFIRGCLDWAWDELNVVEWEAFADDIRHAKNRVENILAEGLRAQHGVQCFDCNADLVRYASDRHEPSHCEGHGGVCHWPHKFCPHDRGGLVDEWVCPSCGRTYDVESYYRAVSHAHRAHADRLTADEIANQYRIKPATLRKWAERGQVRKHGKDHSGRQLYDVEQAIKARDGDTPEWVVATG